MPDPQWRTRWRRSLTALTAAAAGLFVIGVIDLVSGDSLAANLAGGLFTALAALTLVAIGKARPGTRRSHSVPGTVAAVTLLLVAVWFAGAVLAAGSWWPTPTFVVAVLAAAAAAVTLVLARAVHRHAD